MAELATIALVGNILQFLEVGIKLAATARRAYKSIDGCIKEDKDLLTDTGRLHSLISSIQTNRSLTQGNGQAAVDDSLIQAAKACDEYASELTTLLETMSIRPGVTRILESLRVSARRILKNGDIHDLEAKMVSAWETLILGLTAEFSQVSLATPLYLPFHWGLLLVLINHPSSLPLIN